MRRQRHRSSVQAATSTRESRRSRGPARRTRTGRARTRRAADASASSGVCSPAAAASARARAFARWRPDGDSGGRLATEAPLRPTVRSPPSRTPWWHAAHPGNQHEARQQCACGGARGIGRIQHRAALIGTAASPAANPRMASGKVAPRASDGTSTIGTHDSTRTSGNTGPAAPSAYAHRRSGVSAASCQGTVNAAAATAISSPA